MITFAKLCVSLAQEHTGHIPTPIVCTFCFLCLESFHSHCSPSLGPSWGNHDSTEGLSTFERCSFLYLKCHSPSLCIFSSLQGIILHTLVYLFLHDFPIRIRAEGRNLVLLLISTVYDIVQGLALINTF